MKTQMTKRKRAVATSLSVLALAWMAEAQITSLPDPTPPQEADDAYSIRHYMRHNVRPGIRFTRDEVRRMTPDVRSYLLSRAAGLYKSGVVDSLIKGAKIFPPVGPPDGLDVNRKSRGYYSPLESAIKSLNPKIVHRLLQAGADPNQWDNAMGVTPLHRVLGISDKEIDIWEHINNSQDRSKTATERQTAGQVILSTKYRPSHLQRDIVELLLNAGADPNGPSDEELRQAEVRGTIRKTYSNGNRVEMNLGPRRLPPLWVALASGDMALANILLDHGADPKTMENTSRTPPSLMVCAANCCDKRMAESESQLPFYRRSVVPPNCCDKSMTEKLHLAGASVHAKFPAMGVADLTVLDLARQNNCPSDFVAFLEDPSTGTTKTLFDGIPGLFGIGSPPTPEADASVADGERRAEPAGRPADAGPESGATGSAR